MEIIKQLESDKNVEREGKFRLFSPIKVGVFHLSVQASYAHYCNPRDTLIDLNEYVTMEFALINQQDDNFIDVGSVFPKFTRLEDLDRYFDGSVYAYVPVDLINDLYKELQSTIIEEGNQS